MRLKTIITIALGIAQSCHAGKSRFIQLPRHLIVIFALALISKGVAAEVQFVSITPDNTSIPENSPVPGDSTSWNWLPKEGNGGILESSGDPERNAPPLVMWIDGLEAKANYEVFGYFWAPGFSEENKDVKPHHWPARFGLGMASLTTFGGKHSERIPWIISPGAKISEVHGVSATVEEDKPLDFGDSKLTTANGDTRLIRARIGVARTDAEGRLPVFIDDFPDSIHCGKTRIDGVAIRKASKNSKPSAGAGGTHALHFALRARDRLSAEREIAAGADVNALDADSLSPLFHPTALGDIEIVRLLLDEGADPNVSGQSVLALTAAASTGDAEMVSLLLEAGAEVPAGKLEPAPWMPKNMDQSHLHPAIAAIRIGSLETLKLMLKKRPDLDLESLGSEFQEGSQNKATSLYLVADAIAMEHDAMAAFLIDRGCTLRTKHFRDGPETFSAPPQFVLLARSITEGDALVKTREAIIRRGVPPVRPENPNSNIRDGFFYGVAPWDGLSAAIRVGNVTLTRQFLLQTGDVKPRYQDLLLALARWSGEPEIISMIEERFPKAGSWPSQNQPATREIEEDDALRLLLPRIQAAPTRQPSNDGVWTMAVLAAPDAANQGALLEVTASSEKGWKVVDRNEVSKALNEAQITGLWENGELRLAELGDRMAADLLLLVSLIESPNIKLIRIEAVDVATGLAVMREHIDRDTFDPKKAIAPLLSRIRTAFLNSKAGGRPKAITMLPFTVSSDVANSRSMTGLFRAAVNAEVDATPGLLAVGMNQIQAIANEQKLGGQENLWAAAFTLEGGVSSLADDKISLTLRLRSLSNKGDETIDSTEQGNANELPAIAARAWKKLSLSDLFGAKVAQNTLPDRKQSLAEAERLLREGEWLMKSGSFEEALPLFERAHLLGADFKRLVPLHLKTLLSISYLRKGPNLSSVETDITEHVLSLYYQEQLLNNLKPIRDLLDQATYYQSLYGEASLVSGVTEFWEIVRFLSFIRASIPKVLPPDADKQEILDFGITLDQYTAAYFRIRATMKRPTMAPLKTFLPRDGSLSAAMLQRNPELLKGWVSIFLVSSATEAKGGRDYEYKEMFGPLFSQNTQGISLWYGKTQLLANEIMGRMDEYRGKHRELREAELDYVRLREDKHSAAGRAFAKACTKLSRHDYYSLPTWLDEYRLQRYGAANLLDRGSFTPPLYSDSMLASLAQEPLASQDAVFRLGYRKTIQRLVEIEQGSAAEAKKTLSINNPKSEYDRLAEKASKSTNSQAAINRLSGGVLLWERIYGQPMYDHLFQRWKRLYLPDDKASPSSDLNARLLVDLRKIDKSMPGVFKLPTIDKVKGSQIWLHYQPYEKQPFAMSNGSGTISIPHRRQPWLVGIECSSGEVTTQVNLARSPGLDPGAAASNSISSFNGNDGFIAQTEDLLLTDVVWPGMNYNTAPIREVSVLINKRDGSIIPMDSLIVIGSPDDLITNRDQSVGAVALGKNFFCLQKTSDPKASYSSNDEVPYQLVRVASTGKVTAITKYGRRPQMTPFDPSDRYPKMIFRDGSRLLVIHDWNHVGRYNPINDSWEMDVREESKKKGNAKALVNSDFRSHNFPHHNIEKHDGTPLLTIDSQTTFPDKLSLVNQGGSEHRIKIQLEIPDNFLNQPVFTDPILTNGTSGSMTGKWWTYAQRMGSDAYHIVVLNQTKDDLILGLQIGPGVGWLPGKRTGVFLPLIWALPKEDLRTAWKSEIEAIKGN